MYKALYRKWRPKTFDEVIGQPHITETLKRQLENERLSHAYLFIGTRGTGKTSSAKILAKAINCEALIDGNPCNACPACIGIDDGSMLDVAELDAASNNGVDHVRALREEAVFTPTALKKRVYIIDEVHMLSIAAFNALLKILEEPPPHLLFILATTEAHKVPATILSRCQRYAFHRVPSSEIAKRLLDIAKWEEITLTDAAAALLANLAEGSMRDALALLDQCSGQKTVDEATVRQFVGLSGQEDILALLRSIAANDTASALEIIHRLYFSGKGMSALLGELSTLMRDILLTKVAAKSAENLRSGSFEQSILHDFAHLSAESLMYGQNVVTETMSDLGRHANQKLAVELCLVRLTNPQLSDDIGALTARVASLEDAGVSMKTVSAPPKRETPAMETEAPVFTEQAPPDAPMDDSPPWEEENMPEHFSPPPELTPPPIYEETPPPMVAPSQEEAPPVVAAPSPPEEKAPDAAPSDDLWQQVLAGIKAQIDIGVFMLISDKNEVKSTVEGQFLHIYAENEFTKMMMEDKAVLSAIEAQASKISGKPMRIQTHSGVPAASGSESKLDALANKAKNLGI